MHTSLALLHKTYSLGTTPQKVIYGVSVAACITLFVINLLATTGACQFSHLSIINLALISGAFLSGLIAAKDKKLGIGKEVILVTPLIILNILYVTGALGYCNCVAVNRLATGILITQSIGILYYLLAPSARCIIDKAMGLGDDKRARKQSSTAMDF